MKISKILASKYLRAADLDGPVAVQIEDVQIETLQSKGKEDAEKGVVYFQQLEKGLVLNVTNTKTIAKLYGDETEDWIGQWVTVFPTETEFGGEMVECLRIKPKAPRPAPIASAEEIAEAKELPI